ncbi:MAG: AMP-dependent synthetase, partial [Rhizobacter sp.]|nr:AMP-dependent synthetase [Rhizobacter sp.]
MSTAPQAFLAARQFLLDHRNDYDAAYAGFTWPALHEFNWALDFFDALALGNEQPALWIVEEDGSEQKLSFADMAHRSNQAANWLREQGVKRGDRVLLMLNNERALWEAMLALIKLGAVMIPTSTLLVGTDLQDRFDRGEVRHVLTNAAQTAKFDNVPGRYSRITTGPAGQGWRSFDEAYGASSEFKPEGITLADDPLLLYFTSGTTSK